MSDLSPASSKAAYIDEEALDESTTKAAELAPTRPSLDYSSFSAFTSSLWRRFLSIWTKRFIWSLIAGQVVSLCITCTNVTTTELVDRHWKLPATQTFFL